MKEIESESNTKFASVKRGGSQQRAHCCESLASFVGEAATSLQLP